MLRPVGKLHAGAVRFAALLLIPETISERDGVRRRNPGVRTALPTTEQPVVPLFLLFIIKTAVLRVGDAARGRRDAVEKWICIAIYYNIDR
jgi:hypothetical protein